MTRGIDANKIVNKLTDRISSLILENTMLQARLEEMTAIIQEAGIDLEAETTEAERDGGTS